MTTTKSVIDVMSEHPEMSMMRELIISSGLLEEERNNQCSPRENISVFNAYHYTVYVPTNEAIKELQTSGKLPTFDQVEAERDKGNTEKADQMQQKIIDFVRYHIQDNAMYIGANPIDREKYETACIGSNGKFERIYVTLGDDNITIQTSADDQNPAHVVKKEGLYNLQAREYFLNSSKNEDAKRATTSSSAVIHLIDKALVKGSN
jgi:hypothetical protein